MLPFVINIFVPLIAGLVYFVMAAEIKRLSKIRKIMFGEIGYNKAFTAFLLFGIYLVTRPFQNLLGPHPWPMVVNSARQFFLMAIIAPSILVSIFHWVPTEKGTPKTVVWASYSVGFFMALNFVLVNTIAIDGSKLLATFCGINIYDAMWFTSEQSKFQLVIIHLISQLVSPVGFFLMAGAYVRRRRHLYPPDSLYNLMPKKWKYLEWGLFIFAFTLILAGLSAFLGQYYTYLWVIYFIGAIIAGVVELIGVKLPPRTPPEDLVAMSKI